MYYLVLFDYAFTSQLMCRHSPFLEVRRKLAACRSSGGWQESSEGKPCFLTQPHSFASQGPIS